MKWQASLGYVAEVYDVIRLLSCWRYANVTDCIDILVWARKPAMDHSQSKSIYLHPSRLRYAFA